MNKFMYKRKYRNIDYEIWSLGITKTREWIGEFLIMDTKKAPTEEDYKWLPTWKKDIEDLDISGNLVRVIVYALKEVDQKERESIEGILEDLLQFYDANWFFEVRHVANYNELHEQLKKDIETYGLKKAQKAELKRMLDSLNIQFFGGWERNE